MSLRPLGSIAPRAQANRTETQRVQGAQGTSRHRQGSNEQSGRNPRSAVRHPKSGSPGFGDPDVAAVGEHGQGVPRRWASLHSPICRNALHSPGIPPACWLIPQMSQHGRSRENRPFSPIYPCCITLPLTGLIQHGRAASADHPAEPSRGTARSGRSRHAHTLPQASRARCAKPRTARNPYALISCPPSTSSETPVMYEARFEARKSTALAMSCGSHERPSGTSES